MSRLSASSLASATGATAQVFGQIKKAIGSLPNTFAAIGTHGPAALQAYLAFDGALASASLSKRDQETVKLVVSQVAGCDYCVAAHSFLARRAGLAPDEIRAIRAGDPTGDVKRDALARFVRILVQTSGTIRQEDLAAVRAAGYSDAELVEISLAIAATVFTNIFNRINDTDIDFPPVA